MFKHYHICVGYCSDKNYLLVAKLYQNYKTETEIREATRKHEYIQYSILG